MVLIMNTLKAIVGTLHQSVFGEVYQEPKATKQLPTAGAGAGSKVYVEDPSNSDDDEEISSSITDRLQEIIKTLNKAGKLEWSPIEPKKIDEKNFYSLEEASQQSTDSELRATQWDYKWSDYLTTLEIKHIARKNFYDYGKLDGCDNTGMAYCKETKDDSLGIPFGDTFEIQIGEDYTETVEVFGALPAVLNENSEKIIDVFKDKLPDILNINDFEKRHAEIHTFLDTIFAYFYLQINKKAIARGEPANIKGDAIIVLKIRDNVWVASKGNCRALFCMGQTGFAKGKIVSKTDHMALNLIHNKEVIANTMMSGIPENPVNDRMYIVLTNGNIRASETQIAEALLSDAKHHNALTLASRLIERFSTSQPMEKSPPIAERGESKEPAPTKGADKYSDMIVIVKELLRPKNQNPKHELRKPSIGGMDLYNQVLADKKTRASKKDPEDAQQLQLGRLDAELSNLSLGEEAKEAMVLFQAGAGAGASSAYNDGRTLKLDAVVESKSIKTTSTATLRVKTPSGTLIKPKKAERPKMAGGKRAAPAKKAFVPLPKEELKA